jgi:hypothetical protein
VDKKLAAEKIRARLERRIATFLGCEVGELPRMKIGTLVHTIFLLYGDTEDLGGFSTSMSGVLQILGNEVGPRSEGGRGDAKGGGGQLMKAVDRRSKNEGEDYSYQAPQARPDAV